MKLRAVIFISVLTLIFGITANAATRTVTKSTNSNDGVCNADCSLREAVSVANSGDTVVFDSNLIGQTFTLGGDNIEIDENITIDGNIDGVNVAFLSGSNTSRHFLIKPLASLTLKNMILAQGNGTGSGIVNSGGSIEVSNFGFLHLDRVAIRGNTSGGTAGAIKFNGNTPTNPSIINSSITGNTARSAPAIYNEVNLHIANTTISGNRVINPDVNGWGAIANFGNLYMRNCTVVNNEGKNGGGIVAFSGFNPNTNDNEFTNLGNTIVAENTATDSGQDILYFSNMVSVGGNLIGNTNTIPGGIFVQTNDAVNLNSLVAPINSNQGGHPITTHPLQAGSPAIGTGRNSLAVEPLFGTPLTTDGRGIGFPRIFGANVDKGAFEDQSGSSTLIVSKLTNSNDGVCDTDCSLREAVQAAGNDAGTDNITFAFNVFGTMTLGGSEIVIQNQNVNIIGYPNLNSDTLIVSGSNTNRVFYLDNANVTMTGFTIANGNGAGQSSTTSGGGLKAIGGSLTLNQMIVRNNSIPSVNNFPTYGGGIDAFDVNVVRIMNSTINSNLSTIAPAANLGDAVSYITNSTISGNTGSEVNSSGSIFISGSLYMRNSTVANNRISQGLNGAGLHCGAGAICNLGNNIFADNIAVSAADLYVQNSNLLQSIGGNLVKDTTGFNNANMSQPNDALGVDPMLMPLADNGGNVPTIMLNPTSPAINSGINANASDPFSAATLATDARGSGYMRVVSIVDKGAFETLIPTAAMVSVGGHVNVNGAGLRNAVVVLTDNQGISRSVKTTTFGYFKFDDVEVGQTYTVSVMSKQFQFSPQILSVTDEITELNFTAEP